MKLTRLASSSDLLLSSLSSHLLSERVKGTHKFNWPRAGFETQALGKVTHLQLTQHALKFNSFLLLILWYSLTERDETSQKLSLVLLK
jgi:hypothetical protein